MFMMAFDHTQVLRSFCRQLRPSSAVNIFVSSFIFCPYKERLRKKKSSSLTILYQNVTIYWIIQINLYSSSSNGFSLSILILGSSEASDSSSSGEGKDELCLKCNKLISSTPGTLQFNKFTPLETGAKKIFNFSLSTWSFYNIFTLTFRCMLKSWKRGPAN